MARPLRKRKLDGALYERRLVVAEEIAEIGNLELDDLVARCQLSPKSTSGYVSSEAVLYYVRAIPLDTAHGESLFKILMDRVLRLLPRPATGVGKADLANLEIRDRVMDALVDRIVADQNEYEERLDYFEINFNQALARDRMDASSQVRTEQKRSVELDNENDELAFEVEHAVDSYDPFDPEELDKKDYRRLLDQAIDTLPPLQIRIVELLHQEIPITSKDPDAPTISNILGKAEKTIRNHRDLAFATLRRRLERKEWL